MISEEVTVRIEQRNYQKIKEPYDLCTEILRPQAGLLLFRGVIRLESLQGNATMATTS